MQIIPSAASADQCCLAAELDKVRQLKAIHLDIEDGNFIPNITFGLKTVKQITQIFEGVLDAHLMVTDPQAYVEPLAACGVRSIAVHIESLEYPSAIIDQVQSKGCRIGLALNPQTSLEAVQYYADEVDYFLVMTAEPDGRGQRFMPGMIEKIKTLKSRIKETQEIWVDGGLGCEEAKLTAAAGASVFIMGRAVFTNPDPLKFVRDLERQLKKAVLY